MPKYQKGGFVVHGREICKIVELIKNYREDGDYYKLQALSDPSLITYSPIDKQDKLIRPVITKSEAEKLIGRLNDIETVEVDTKTLEAVYSDLSKSSRHEDIIRLIKTAYKRCEEREKKGAAKPERDKLYFRLAEKLLYSEFAIALGKTYEETKAYIVSRAEAAEAKL